jgi:hypothetical protein
MAYEDDPEALARRRQARAEQAVVVQLRLDRHRVIAARLLEDHVQAAELIARGQAMVARWRAERLCSNDYSDAWTALLAKEPAEIAAAIVSDANGWDALRQCSPWPGGADGQ